MAEQTASLGHFGKIDCLVANVGSGRPSTEDKLDSREWENSFQINLFSSVKLVHVFHDMWDVQKGGSIVIGTFFCI